MDQSGKSSASSFLNRIQPENCRRPLECLPFGYFSVELAVVGSRGCGEKEKFEVVEILVKK